jgi:hypothetical protein
MQTLKRTYLLNLLICFFIGTLLTGCSSLKVVETWHKPAAQGQYKKVMILGVGSDETKRKLFEDIIVDELRRNMVTAVASHTILPDLDKTDRDGVVAAVKTAGCDAVLTTRPLSIGDKTVSQQGAGGSVGYVYGASPMTTYGNFLKATLQATLFDARSEELVWSATLQTFDGDRLAKVSRDMGKFFFETLRKDGLL